MSGGKSSSTANTSTATADNRAAADAQALAVTGTSGSQIARDGGVSAGGKFVSGLDISSAGSATVNITDGEAVKEAMSLVRDAGTTMQQSMNSLLAAKQTDSGKLSTNQITLLIVGAVATAIASKAFKG